VLEMTVGVSDCADAANPSSTAAVRE
jgi:hypothetical protein